MILYRWRGAVTNFGDELNMLLWPALLPGFFDENPATRFLGIGSVLDRRHDGPGLKIVAGAGYGGYEAKPRLDASWVIHWVRGPRTARILGLDPRLGLGDPAVLAPGALGLARGRGGAVGFMPHFESIARGTWAEAATMAGLTLIDPRDPPHLILRRMAGCRLILSEALHGIIVADALRVPWVPLRPLAPVHRAKWHDWSATLGLRLRFAHIPASSLGEWLQTSRLARYWAGPEWAEGLRQRLNLSLRARTERSAGVLSRLSEADPQLSADAALDRCCSRQHDALARLRRASVPCAEPLRRRRTRLRPESDSAYELPVIG